MKIAYPFLLLALLAPATASAQTPPPDERAAAQAMADAAKRAFADIEALYAPSDARMSRPCKLLDTVPERRERDALTLFLGLGLRHNAPAIAPRLGEFRTELANIQTADPALIAGRAVWRRWGRAVSATPAYRGDICAAIGRWRKAGYPRAAVRDAVAVLIALAPTRGMARRGKAAVRRMIALGVSREDAKAFSLAG